jgi:hypothetical protein
MPRPEAGLRCPSIAFSAGGWYGGFLPAFGGGLVEKGTPTRLLVDLCVGLGNGHRKGEILERMRSRFSGSCVYIFGGLVLYCIVLYCIMCRL